MKRIRLKASFFAAALAAALAASDAIAASSSTPGPQSSWTDMQKYEFNVGKLAGALNLCRRYSLHAELQKLASLSPYGRKGLKSLLSFDGLTVGGCARVKGYAEDVLRDKERLQEYLEGRYNCSTGDCVER